MHGWTGSHAVLLRSARQADGAQASTALRCKGLGLSDRGSEMGRWLRIGLVAAAIGALSGCAGALPGGAAYGEPCWGFYMCADWH